MLQVQLIDSAHERQVSIADGPRPVIDRATAEIEQLGLTRHAQWMFTVDHRFALSNPALVSAPFQKIVLQGQLPDLGVQRRQIHRLRRRATAEHVGCTFQQLLLPSDLRSHFCPPFSRRLINKAHHPGGPSALRRDHFDFNAVMRAGQTGAVHGGARWRMARYHPLLPSAVHLVKGIHISQPDGG